MKITKVIKGNTTIYFYDGIKKYEHCKDYDGYEYWKEYKDGKEIHFKNSYRYEIWKEYKDDNEIYFKDSKGNECWSDDNPDNPNNKVKLLKEKDVKPFKFN